jgi:hypothetical protein
LRVKIIFQAKQNTRLRPKIKQKSWNGASKKRGRYFLKKNVKKIFETIAVNKNVLIFAVTNDEGCFNFASSRLIALI